MRRPRSWASAGLKLAGHHCCCCCCCCCHCELWNVRRSQLVTWKQVHQAMLYQMLCRRHFQPHAHQGCSIPLRMQGQIEHPCPARRPNCCCCCCCFSFQAPAAAAPAHLASQHQPYTHASGHDSDKANSTQPCRARYLQAYRTCN